MGSKFEEELGYILSEFRDKKINFYEITLKIEQEIVRRLGLSLFTDEMIKYREVRDSDKIKQTLKEREVWRMASLSSSGGFAVGDLMTYDRARSLCNALKGTFLFIDWNELEKK